MRGNTIVVRRTTRWLGLVLAASLAVILLGGVGAHGAQGEPPYDTMNECLDARPIKVDPLTWSCQGSRAMGWTPVQAGARSAASGAGSAFGAFFAIALLWSGIPLLIAASMASSRGESMGMAIGLTLFLGWLGLAIVYFGQQRTTSAVRGLAAVGADRATASSPQNRDVPPTRAELAWPSSSRPDTDDATGRLQKLEDLRGQGLITDTECADQRQRILDDI